MPSARGIWENVIVGLIVLVIVAAATWIATKFDEALALWLALLIAFGALLLGVGIGRLMRFGEDLPGYQADLIAEAMLGLREVVAGQLDVSFDEFIERGVLAPARFGISVVSGEEIRLSVLRLDDDGRTFRVLYESGHTLGRKSNFSLCFREKGSLMAHGSMPPGPSDLYLDLLKGKISPEEYAKRAKKRLHEEARKQPSSTSAQSQRF
jgi:hypothetical protein